MPGKKIAAKGGKGGRKGAGGKGGKGAKGGKAKGGAKNAGTPRRLRRGDDVSLTSDEMSQDVMIEDDESIDSDEAFGPEDEDLKRMFEEIDVKEKKEKTLKAAEGKKAKAAAKPAAKKGAKAKASKVDEEERIYASDETVSEGSDYESDSGSDTGMINLSDLLDGPAAAPKKKKQAPKLVETQKEGQFASSSLRTIEAPSLADLVGQTVETAGEAAGEGMARISKKLQKLQDKEGLVVDTPEDAYTIAERERGLTREGVDKDLGQWSQVVHHQRAKEFSQFPLPEPEAIAKPTTTNAGEVMKASNDMEKEIDGLLAASGLKSEQKEITSSDFVKLEGDVFGLVDKGADTAVGRLKTILASEHDRKRRVKKIKSKTYRRMVRKEKEKEKDKRLELLALVDPEAALKKKKEEMLKLRAKERMTQKHKNKSQWIKHVKHMAKWDPETRNAMANQNRIHNQLMQKMDESIEQAAYNKAGSDDEDSSIGEDDAQIDSLLTEGGNKSALWNLRKDIEEGDGEEKKKGVWGMKFMRKNDQKQKEELLRMVDELEDDVDRYRKGEEPIGEGRSGEPTDDDDKPAAKSVGKMRFDGGDDEDAGEAKGKRGRKAAQAASQKAPTNKGAAAVTDDTKGEDVEMEVEEDAKDAKSRKRKRGVEAKVSTAKGTELEVEVDEALLAKAAQKTAKAKSRAAQQEQERAEAAAAAEAEAAEEAAAGEAPRKKRKLVRRVVVKRKAPARLASGGATSGEDEAMTSEATSGAITPKKVLKRSASAAGFTQKKRVSFSEPVEEPEPEAPAAAAEAAPPAKKKKVAKKKAAAAEGVLQTEDGIVMTQDYLIGRAFAEDTLASEFQKEKDADIEKDVGQIDISEALPGWGEWGGEDPTLNERSKQRRTELETERAEKVSKLRKKRKDAKLNHVIINENEDVVDSKYTLSKVPFPYRSAEQYEASMATPLGSDWNTETRAALHVRPKMKTKKGEIITPLEKEQGTRKAPKTKRRKMAKKGGKGGDEGEE